MKYAYLGKGGVKVSRLCLGTMNFGPLTSEEEAFEILDLALESGINFIDTADCYGTMPEGHTGWAEEILGKWFSLGGGRREKVVLATKVYWPMNDENLGPNDEPSLSAYKIRRNVEGCLKRLNTDHIDLLQFHRPDRRVSWDEVWDEVQRLKMSGKVTYVGASNFNAYDLAKAEYSAKERHHMGFVTSQNRYNLLYRRSEGDFHPAVKEMGLGLLCWSPLAEGYLAGVHKKKQGSGRHSLVGEIDQKHLERLNAYSDLCEELGYSEAEVSLAWLMQRDIVTSVLIGPRTVEHFRKNIKAADIVLGEETLRKIDEIFPKGEPYIEQGLNWNEID